MRRSNLVFLLLFHCYIVISASAQENCSSCGVVKYSYKFYDSALQAYIEQVITPVTIWYRDSCIIEMVTDVPGNEDKITVEAVMKNYAFVNVEAGSVIEYPRFSPSAPVLKKFSLAEAPVLLNGRAAYDPARKITGVTMAGKLPDTIINGIVYKRMSSYYIRSETGDRYDFEEFFRCDINTSLFNLDREADNIVGCPCVRVDVVPRNESSASRQIEFVSNKLTAEESAVFDAWNKGKNK